jgi:hypothetical protein
MEDMLSDIKNPRQDDIQISVNYNILVQDLVLVLTHHYTMAQPGSLLSTKHYINNYLRWEDVKVLQRFENNNDGIFLGYNVIITLQYLKGHQFVSDLKLRCGAGN